MLRAAPSSCWSDPGVPTPGAAWLFCVPLLGLPRAGPTIPTPRTSGGATPRGSPLFMSLSRPLILLQRCPPGPGASSLTSGDTCLPGCGFKGQGENKQRRFAVQQGPHEAPRGGWASPRGPEGRPCAPRTLSTPLTSALPPGARPSESGTETHGDGGAHPPPPGCTSPSFLCQVTSAQVCPDGSPSLTSSPAVFCKNLCPLQAPALTGGDRPLLTGSSRRTGVVGWSDLPLGQPPRLA